MAMNIRVVGFVKRYGLEGFKTKIAAAEVMKDDLKEAVRGLETAASKEYLCGPATLQVAAAGNDIDIHLGFPARTFGYPSANEVVRDLKSSLAA